MFVSQQYVINITASNQSNDSSPIDCVKLSGSDPCKEASADVIVIYSSLDSVKQMVVFFLSPTLGKIADCVGRMPFMYFNSVAFIATQLFQFLSVNQQWHFQWFLLCSVFQGLFPQQTVVIMMLSDTTPKDLRLSLFGVIFMGMFATLPICSLSISLLGLDYSNLMMYIFTIASSLIVLSLRETLSNYLVLEGVGVMNPFTNLSILFRNTTFMALAFVLFCSQLSSEGQFNVLKFYCFDVLHFSYSDLTLLYTCVALAAILFNSPIITSTLTKQLGHKHIMIIATSWSVIIHIYLGIVDNKYAFMGGMFFSCFSIISIPTILAVKSNLCSETEQGLIQGALGAVQNMGMGVGPIIFSYVYKQSDKRNAFFLYSAIYFVSLIVLITGVDLTRDQQKKIDNEEFLIEGEQKIESHVMIKMMK